MKNSWSRVASIIDPPNVSYRGIEATSSSIVETAAKRAGRIAGRTAASTSVLDFGGPSGSSLPSVLATGSALSTFQYTLSRADRLSLFRYFSRTDPFVGRAIELHSELPMSRISIGPPKGPVAKQNREINRIYENMSERLGLLQFLLEVSREYWLAGDTYIWHEWDDEILQWKDVYILPVEYCHSVLHPFNRRREIIFFARPLVDTAAVRRMTDRDLYLVADAEIEKLYEDLGDEVPEELKDALNYGEAVPLNTNPRKGSYVVHLSRNRPPNEEYGQSIVERCLETLLRLENLKNAQLQISSRNMNPKHLVWGEGIGETELLSLRNQIDLSLLEHSDYPIVTNYPVEWKTVGANDRLLQVGEEYSTLREDLATGLGTTKDMLTGQGGYGQNRLILEMMNTQYLTFREVMRIYVEEYLFRPVAQKNGHYYREEIPTWVEISPEDCEVDDELMQESDGTLRKKQMLENKVWNHSALRFNRLSIRDNTEVYEQLFQLHQKGSLALRYLLDIHNIDAEENTLALLEDMGTVRDSTFNDLLRGVYSAAAAPLLEETDMLERIIKGLDLKVKQSVSSTPGGDLGGMPMGDMGLGGDMGMGDGMGESPLGDEGLEPNPDTEPLGPTARKNVTPRKLQPGKILSTNLKKRLIEGVQNKLAIGQRVSKKDIKSIMFT